MIDLTEANEQYLQRNDQESQRKQRTKQRVQETKGVVEYLLAAPEQSESQERDIAKQQAQQFLQTLQHMYTEFRHSVERRQEHRPLRRKFSRIDETRSRSRR